MSSWPPPPDDLVYFIAFLSLKNLSFNTAKSYISAISYKCKIMNMCDNTQQFIVKKCLEGMRRTKSRADSRLPITESILLNIVSRLPGLAMNMYESKLFKAAFVIAFWGLFRVGEITLTKSKPINQIIAYQDVKFEGDSVVILVRFSKSDQTGKGDKVILKKTKGLICPVASLQEYLEKRPNIPGPLFCHFNGNPISRFQFSAMLNKCLTKAGLNLQRFTSHSFRIGGASFLARNGHSTEEIMNRGRWRSSSYKSYIR